MRAILLIFLLFFVNLSLLQPSFAVLPDEILENAQSEQRARAISQKIRCLVCQNENIDDSNAALARDLRLLVRERLTKGDSDKQVIDFLVARYGEFVLLQPRFYYATYFLYGAPIIIIFGSFFIYLYSLNRKKHLKTMPLTEEEQQKLATILKDNA